VEGGGRLAGVEHLVVVMMENRSFDHMCGYLNLPPWNAMRPAVDGVSLDPAWIARYTNMLDGRQFPPYAFTERRIDDPPHTRPTSAMQLGTSAGAAGPMTGFVASYAQRKQRPRSLSHVMGYYTAPELPIFDFFARNFTVCDRWFSPLPAGTQPNRLMALAGFSKLGDNAPLYLPDQDLVYDWLNERGIRWRVYHDGIVPFIGLMRKWMQTIGDDDHKPLSDDPRFRWLDSLENDLKAARSAAARHLHRARLHRHAKIRGLHRNDFIMAAKTDALGAESEHVTRGEIREGRAP